MGLDMYIEKKKKEFCPHCGCFLGAKPDFYVGSELCYWRKNWELFNFISSDIAPDGYGNKQYGQDLELSVADIKKIIEFEESRKNHGDDYQIQNDSLQEGIEWLEADANNIVCYSADW